jgi:hypothetical protein
MIFSALHRLLGAPVARAPTRTIDGTPVAR